ncbi:hypothetical protein GCM10009712_01770 [Pseudarthrobacter sulfonivorans]|uniref:hypothetical protein n=1 Tax=Pseudarthrobacter sulfonivorans TaxID=121292 RepID=UPI00168B9662|nr:hypothetical protein [Pseudarthrobacter sulfonivorans]
MDPVTAWIVAVASLVVVVILSKMLIRRWNRENRAKYPKRFSGSHRFIEINRAPRH